MCPLGMLFGAGNILASLVYVFKEEYALAACHFIVGLAFLNVSME